MTFDLPIVSSTTVPWDRLTLPVPVRPNYLDEVLRRPLQAFAQPGYDFTKVDLATLIINEDGIVVPDTGNYFLIGGFGVIKLLVLPNDDSELAVALAIFRFLVECSWHTGTDNYLFHCRRKGFRRVDRILEKLFFSDQPLGLKCGDMADILAFLLNEQGIVSRRITMFGGNVRHIVIEADVDGRAVWLDADYGVVVECAEDLVGLQHIHAVLEKNQLSELQAKAVGEKPNPVTDRNYSSRFSGQFSWSPRMSRPRPGDYLSTYRTKILGIGIRSSSIASFEFDTDEEGRRFMKAAKRKELPVI